MTDISLVVWIVGAGVALLLIRIGIVERRLHRLARLESKLDALLRQAGIAFDPYHDVPDEVREALERGERILAIRRLREATGVGLKEAKEIVDEVTRRQAPAR